MELKKVISSHLDMVGYDALNSTMMIQFKTGDIYEYSGVDEQTYNDLLTSQSIGQYFTKNIRNRFSYKKLGNEKDLLKV